MVAAEIANNAQSNKSDFELVVSVKEAPNQLLSVSEYIEHNSDHVRSIYLQWVFEMGQQRIRGNRSLSEILNIQDGINLWQMSLVAEKSIWKTPEILNALQIIALHELLLTYQVDHVELLDSDAILSQMVQQVCDILGTSFSTRGAPKNTHIVRTDTHKRRISASYALLKYAVRRIPYVVLAEKSRLKHFNPKFVLVSYLHNFTIDSTNSTEPVKSDYWGPLVSKGIGHTAEKLWIEIPPNSDSMRIAFREALEVRRINKLLGSSEKHVILHSYLSLRSVIKAFNLFREQVKNASDLSGAINLPTSQGIDLSPLLKNAWIDSIIGATALRNILWALLFQSALEKYAESSTCIYLQENQAWEISLLNTWRSKRRGKIIGFPHVTLRYWDLRYFFDPRNFMSRTTKFAFPDITIANGDYAMSQLIKGGIQPNFIRKAEALRYLNLRKHSQRRTSTSNQNRVLIVGEYDEVHMKLFTSWIIRQQILGQHDTTVIVKPHPSQPLTKDLFQSLQVEITNKPLTELFDEVDLVLTGSTSSAAVEAYLSGVPLITITSDDSMNFGPLRGFSTVSLTMKEQLTASHVTNAQTFANQPADESYFYRDAEIPAWKALLQSGE